MTTASKITTLLDRNFLLMGSWQQVDRQIVSLDGEENVTLLETSGQSHCVPLSQVSDIGFASPLVPERYLSIDEYEKDLTTRFAIFCQLTDLTDETASRVLGRTVRLEELYKPDDWKAICVALLGL